MTAFVVAPMALFSMLAAFVPLILLGVIIYFLVQIKQGLEEVSAEIRDTRMTIRDAMAKLGQSANPGDSP